MRYSFAASLAVLAGVSFASPVELRAATLLPPSTDPFYQAPSNVASLSPGTIVRYRPVPAMIQTTTGALSYSSAYQIVFRTTSNSGAAEVGMTTLIVPKNATKTKLLSYQVAEDSAYVNCAPSYGMQAGAPGSSGANVKLEMANVQKGLNMGFYMVVPDFEGPHATFLANTGAGQRVLDSARAALASGSFSGIGKAVVAFTGYSGGSQASGFAAELQESYAPELPLVGAALGGTVPNIRSTLDAVNETPFAGLIPAGVLGLAHAYPALAAYINTVIIPAKNASFQEAGMQCLVQDATKYAFKNVYTYVNNPNAFNSPIANMVINANMQGQRGPKAPIYIYKGKMDQISPVNDTQIMVNSYCGFGTSVDYVLYAAGTHISVLTSGFGPALAWLSDRLSGIGQTGCTTKVIEPLGL